MTPNQIFLVPLACLLLFPKSTRHSERLHVEAYSSYTAGTLPDDVDVDKMKTMYDSIIDRAQHVIGLPGSDIEIETTSRYGAFSVINPSSHRRFLVYSPVFFTDVNTSLPGGTAVMSICFHEFAHLYYQHPLKPSYASQLFEKQADRFSGYEMALAGATLDQSLAAMTAFGNEAETYTHPAKWERLGEIRAGYIDAKINILKDTAFIRQDSIRRSYTLMAVAGVQLSHGDVISKSGIPNPTSHNKSRRNVMLPPPSPRYDLLGETVYFSADSKITSVRGGRVLGKVLPSSGTDQVLDIEGVKYALKDGIIYAKAPDGLSLEVGRKIKQID